MILKSLSDSDANVALPGAILTVVAVGSGARDSLVSALPDEGRNVTEPSKACGNAMVTSMPTSFASTIMAAAPVGSKVKRLPVISSAPSDRVVDAAMLIPTAVGNA